MNPGLLIGDEVKLKTSDQPMTIEDIQDGIAYCVWMYKGKQEKGQFSITSLAKLDIQSTYPKVIQQSPSIVEKMRGHFFPEKR